MSIVYILTNEAMPGYIKIGRTETSVSQRMSELDKTSIPLPFQCYYAAKVDDYAKVERTLHTAFGDHRVRPSREFFRMDPYKAKVILELIAVADVTPGDDLSLDLEGKDALEKWSRFGIRYNMEKYGILPDSVLEYASDRSITCVVVDEKTVNFGGEQVSLSRAAGLANAARGGTAATMPGPIYWLHEGETLASIRARLDEDW